MSPRTVKPRGPRGAAAKTRDEIVRAAYTVFTEQGYEATSMRAVAREAGVDPALPRHYFASKNELFMEACGPRFDPSERVKIVIAGPPSEIGERIVRTFVGLWDDPEIGPRMQTLLRNASAHEAVAELMRTMLFNQVFVKVATSFGISDVEMRAAATASQLMGLAMARYIVKIDAVVNATEDELVAIYGPTIQRYVTGSA